MTNDSAIKITVVGHRDTDLVNTLFGVWDASVRATHDFLTEDDIVSLEPDVRQALTGVETLSYVTDDRGTICGFMGVAEGNIEMLFIHPEQRGCGIGTSLIDFAVRKLQVSSVDVNEQNQQAVGFYKHVGFVVVRRSALDGQGRPFPILHMKWSNGTPTGSAD